MTKKKKKNKSKNKTKPTEYHLVRISDDGVSEAVPDLAAMRAAAATEIDEADEYRPPSRPRSTRSARSTTAPVAAMAAATAGSGGTTNEEEESEAVVDAAASAATDDPEDPEEQEEEGEPFRRRRGMRLVGSRRARHAVYHPAGLPLAYVLLRGTAGPHRENLEEDEDVDTEADIYGPGGKWEEDDPDFAKFDREPEARRDRGLPPAEPYRFHYPPNKVEKLFPEFFSGTVLPPSVVEDFHLRALLGISEWDGIFRDAVRDWNLQASRSDKTEERLAQLLAKKVQGLLARREEDDSDDLGEAETGRWTVSFAALDEDDEEGPRSRGRRRRWTDNEDDDDSTDPGEPRDYGPPAGDIVACHPGYGTVYERDGDVFVRSPASQPPSSPPVRMVLEVGIGNDKWWEKFDGGINRLQRMPNFAEGVVYVVLTLDLNEDDPGRAVVTSSKIAAFLVTPGMTDLRNRGGNTRLDEGYEIALLWHRRQRGLREVTEGVGRVLRAVSMTPCWMPLSKVFLRSGAYQALGRNHARYRYKVLRAYDVRACPMWGRPELYLTGNKDIIGGPMKVILDVPGQSAAAGRKKEEGDQVHDYGVVPEGSEEGSWLWSGWPGINQRLVVLTVPYF